LYPLYAENTGSGYGAYIESVSGVASQMQVGPSSTNSVVPVLNISRASSGTAANGIGGSIDWYNQTVASGSVYSGSIANKWTDAINASRTSQTIISGVLNTATVEMLTLNANGSIQLRPITATEASAITAADGMILYSNSTNGTFTSIGFWMRENGVWVKM
jgi:hypothetical protein